MIKSRHVAFCLQALWPSALRITEAILASDWERASGDRNILVFTPHPGVIKQLNVEQLTELKTQMSQIYDALTPMVSLLRRTVLYQYKIYNITVVPKEKG